MSFSLSPLDLTAQAAGESGGNPYIGQHNPARSSAGGLFGFTAPTWAGMIRNHPELGLTMDGKNDPDQQRRAYPVFAQDNSNTLQSLGAPTTPSAVSLAAFLGPKAAAAFTTADPNDLASTVLAQAIGPQLAKSFMTSNPEILSATAKVGDVIAHNDKTHLAGGGFTEAPQGAPAGAAPNALPAQAMPDGFGQSTRGPSPVAKVDESGTEGNTLLTTGLAMMGGAQGGTGFTDAGKALEAAQARQQAVALRNAEFKNDAVKRDWDEPNKAAEAAYHRALAWNTMQAPTTLTAQQAAQLEQERLRGAREDRNHAEQIAVERARLDETKRQYDSTAKPTQTLILPGDTPGQEQTLTVTTGRDGSTAIRNMTTGEDLDRLPTGAVDIRTYNARENQVGRLAANADKAVGGILQEGQAGKDRARDIDNAVTAANAPGVNAGPDIGSRMARAVFPLLGINVSEQDMANMSLAQVSNAVSAAAAKGQGAVSDNERKLFATLAPQMTTSPDARNQMFDYLKQAALRPALVADAWVKASPEEKRSAQSSLGALAEWKYQTTQRIADQQAAAHLQTIAAKAAPATAAAPAPPASTFWRSPAAPTTGAPPAQSTGPQDFTYAPQ